MKKKIKHIGGLVLKTKELKAILEIPYTVGIAFAIAKNGIIQDVDLRVMRVERMDGNLYCEEKPVKFKKGSSRFNQVHSGTTEFKFENEDQLISKKFKFGYITKERFEEIVRNSEQFVFISGAESGFGSTALISGSWPTLAISACTEFGLESMNAMGNPPQSYILEACPPVWDFEPPEFTESIQQKFLMKMAERTVTSS